MKILLKQEGKILKLASDFEHIVKRKEATNMHVTWYLNLFNTSKCMAEIYYIKRHGKIVCHLMFEKEI